jgi:hypothetical protein
MEDLFSPHLAKILHLRCPASSQINLENIILAAHWNPLNNKERLED